MKRPIVVDDKHVETMGRCEYVAYERGAGTDAQTR